MLSTSYLIVIFELRLTRILTLPNIQEKVEILYVGIGSEKMKEGKKEQVCSDRTGFHIGRCSL